MKFKNLLITVLAMFFVTTTVFGAKYKGYIINKEGIKVIGLIKTKNVTTDQIKIVFYEQGKKKATYKPTSIQGYGYEHISENQFGEDVFMWRHYRSKTAQSYAPRMFASKEVFMEVMEEGEVTVYDYYVQVPSNIEDPYKRFFYLERAGSDEFIEISKENYIKKATSYFEDYSKLSSRIGKVNHRFYQLYKVVKLYNDWAKKHNKNEVFPF